METVNLPAKFAEKRLDTIRADNSVVHNFAGAVEKRPVFPGFCIQE